MVLQLDWSGFFDRVVICYLFMAAGPEVVLPVVSDNTIVQNGGKGLLEKVALGIPFGGFENDIISLPLSGGTRGVDQGWLVAINR